LLVGGMARRTGARVCAAQGRQRPQHVQQHQLVPPLQHGRKPGQLQLRIGNADGDGGLRLAAKQATVAAQGVARPPLNPLHRGKMLSQDA
jgi:hypothetical protein